MKSERKPPLPKSPIRARPRRVLRSTTTTSVQTPPGSLTKTQKLNPGQDMEESELRPEYRTISWELRALARMVHDEFGKENRTNAGERKSSSVNSSPLFERGRFYDVYSARRNERLKRKNGGETGEEGAKTPYNLGVNIESSKKRDTKKLASLRKSVSAAYSVERSEIPRYSLRSLSKENKKPPLPISYDKSVLASERKVGARRGVRKI